MRIFVTTAADSGPGSLRAALAAASGPTVTEDVEIFFAPALKGATIRLASALEVGSGGRAITVHGDVDFDPDDHYANVHAVDGDRQGDVTISGDTDRNGVAGPGDSPLLAVAARQERISFRDFRFEGGFAAVGADGTAALIETDGPLGIARSEIVGGLVRGGDLAATIVTRSGLELNDVLIASQVAEGGPEGGDAVAGVAVVQPDPTRVFAGASLEAVGIGGRATGGDSAAGPGGAATVGVSGLAGAAVFGFAIVAGSVATGGAGTPPGAATLGHAAPAAGGRRIETGDGGGLGADTIDRSGETETGFVLGFGGADRIVGGFGVDTLDGGAGNDTLVAALSGGLVRGGAGDDLLFLRVPGSLIRGGAGGGDTLSLELWEGAEGVRFDGSDPFGAVTGVERVIGSPLGDTFSASAFLDGRDGDDHLFVTAPRGVAFGGAGDDTIGGVGRTRLDGGSGDDVLSGGAGGQVTMEGGTGTDTASFDVLFGPNDVAARGGALFIEGFDPRFGPFSYVLRNVERIETPELSFTVANLFPQTGGPGRDSLSGSDLDDTISGGGGRDVIDGGAGDDRLFGQGGGDRLIGGLGGDLLSGGSGADTLGGGLTELFDSSDDRADRLRGGAGSDLLFGQREDSLLGGAGNDRLVFEGTFVSALGGPGRDVFSFIPDSAFGAPSAVIRDFRHGADRIELEAIGFAELSISEVLVNVGRFDVNIRVGEVTVLVTGSQVEDFDRSDFIFV